MKISLGILFLYVGAFTACSAQTPQTNYYILNQKLSTSYNDFNHSFKKLRSPIIFGKNRMANNCKTYFELSANYKIEESVNNQAIKNEYLLCDAMKILSKSSEVKNEKYSNFGKKLLKKLDLRTFPSSLSRLGNDSSYTLAALFPKNISSTSSTALYETADWAFTVEVVAIASINDNSKPDWIIWVIDESKSGNYRGYSTLILFDPDNQASYTATVYPQ